MLSLVEYKFRFHENDPFHDLGNVHSARMSSFLALTEELDLNYIESVCLDQFPCTVENCSEKFTSLFKFQEHYEMRHHHQCSFCRRCFLSERLLSIHLSENHDSYFAVLSSRKPSYQCLVDNCSLLFVDQNSRDHHLVECHCYPVNFSFNLIRSKQRGRLSARAKESGVRGNKINKTNSSAMTDPAAGTVQSNPLEVSNDQIKPRKVCRHFLNGYCRLGSQCNFLHVNTITANEITTNSAQGKSMRTKNDMDVDVAVDNLTDSMATVKIPSKICFGRKRCGKKGI